MYIHTYIHTYTHTHNNWYVLCFLVDCWPYQLLYIYSIPPDDGLQIRPKHVEVD